MSLIVWNIVEGVSEQSSIVAGYSRGSTNFNFPLKCDVIAISEGKPQLRVIETLLKREPLTVIMLFEFDNSNCS